MGVLWLSCDHCGRGTHVTSKDAADWQIVERAKGRGPRERILACSVDHARRAARAAGWRAHAFRAKYLWGGTGLGGVALPHVVHVCRTCGGGWFEEVTWAEYDARKAKGMTGGWVGLPSEPHAEGECPGKATAKGTKRS